MTRVQSDLQITKTDGLSTAAPGAAVTYTIVVRNLGPSDSRSPIVADTFPSELSGVTYTATQTGGVTDFTPSGSGDILDYLSDFPAGGSLTYTAHAAISLSAAGTLSNNATVTPLDPDPDTTNNLATDTDLLVPQADLSLTKIDSPDPVTAGTNLTYAIDLTNNGPSIADNVSWSDTLPAGTAFVSLSAASGWSCSTPVVGSGGDVSCSLSSLPVGSAGFSLVVAVDPGLSLAGPSFRIPFR